MSQNINQIYIANPITTNAATDLMYFGQSPYGAGNDAAMTFVNFNAQIVANGTANQIGYYATTGNKISPLGAVINGVLITNNTGVPSLLANSGTPGYVLTANSGAPPSWQVLGSASGAVLLNPTGSQTITGQNLTLSGATFAITGSGNITVASGAITIASGNITATTGNVFASGGTLIGGVVSGAAGGTLQLYSPSASSGRLFMIAANMAGNFNGIITNASFGQSATLTIPDPGASTANFILSASTGTQTIGSALSITGNFTPSQTNGIVGTTTNNSANAGSIGELFTAGRSSGSALPLTTGTIADMSSILLTAGDWDVWGNLTFVPNGGVTTVSYERGWISATSATAPDSSLYVLNFFGAGFTPGASNGFVVPSIRISISTPTTIYISADASFAVSTLAVCGNIYARRRR